MRTPIRTDACRWKSVLSRAIIAVACGLTGLVGTFAGETDPQRLDRYFEALRARNLFTIAEEYATSRLSDPRLAADRHIQLTIQQARTLVQHGELLTGNSRTGLWEEASRVLEQSLSQQTEQATKLRLRCWQAILQAREGDLLAFDAGLQQELDAPTQQAINLLRPAIRDLKSLTEQLDSRSAAPPAGRSRNSSDQPHGGSAKTPPWDERALQLQVVSSCGKALLSLAELTPSGFERTSLLTDAGRELDHALRLHPSVSQAVALTVLQARRSRLRGDDSQAESLLESAAKTADLDSEDNDDVLSERLRLELQRNQFDVALQMLVDRLRLPAIPSNELRATAVDVLFAAADLAGKKNEADLQQQLLTEAQRQHEQTFGIWRRQTTARLERRQRTKELGAELATLVRQAEAAWQSQKIDEALDQYRAAAALANRSGRREQAFEYALTRASILLQVERWADAEKALSEIVASFPAHPRVAEADLLRCYALGRQQPDGKELVQALQHHLTEFPTAATRGNALWMLGVILEQRGQFEQAASAYRQIPAESPHRTEADYRILFLLGQELHAAKDATAIRATIQTQAGADIARILASVPNEVASLSVLQCRILLECVHLELQFNDVSAPSIERTLGVVKRRIELEQAARATSKTPLTEDWRQLAQKMQQLQILWLASLHRIDEARAILKNLGARDPSTTLSILIGLTELSASLPAARKQDLATLQRVVVREIAAGRNELTADQQILLDRAAVQASLAVGDWPEAIRISESLLARAPRDRERIRELIHVLQQQGSPQDFQKARELWSRLEQLEKPGSVAWIEARIRIAAIMKQNGEVESARKLLGVTRTLYPQMGSPELKAQADQLWAELK